MQTINLKEVAKVILQKNPYRVIRDDRNCETPATEKTQFVDVLTFSVHKVGENFQNIPYEGTSTAWGADKKHVSFIGEDGEVLEEMKCAPLNLMYDNDALKKYRREYKFSSCEETLVFALKLTEDDPKRGIFNYLLFLSKPMSFREIQELRQSVYSEVDSKKINSDLEAVELIWK